MLTVPEAARRAGRNPETIRRWIRAGRLRARKIGTQHVIEEEDLEEALADDYEMLPLPDDMQKTWWGELMPNVVRWVRLSRERH
jgi:excisionase family DNA binding protein